MRLAKEKLRNQQNKISSTTRQVVPFDCQTAFRDDEFLSMADRMLLDMQAKGADGKGVRQRYLLMMSSIKEKVADLGMTSGARRVPQRQSDSVNELQNKLIKMMKARRGGSMTNPEGSLLSP